MSSQALKWVFENGVAWAEPEWITGLIIADDHRGGAGSFLTPAAIAAMSPLCEVACQSLRRLGRGRLHHLRDKADYPQDGASGRAVCGHRQLIRKRVCGDRSTRFQWA